MDFKQNDIVKPSGKGKTDNWAPSIRGKVFRVDEKLRSVFVVWHGTHFEDELKLDELIMVD